MPNSSSHHHHHHHRHSNKLDSSSATTTATRMTYCSATDLDFPPDNEFVELVCENGQIMMQGQSSSRNRKNLSASTGGGGGGGFSSPSSKKDAAGGGGGDVVNSKIGRFGNMDAAAANDYSSAAGGPSSVHHHHHHMGGLNQDDDIGPWLSYPLEDTMQHDYGSDFFSELTGVNLNSLSSSHQTHTTQSQNFGVVPFDNRNNTGTSYSQMIRDSNLTTDTTTTIRPRGSSVNQLECQNSNPSLRPRVSDFSGGNVHQASSRNSKQTPEASGNVLNPKIQKQDQVPITSTPLGLMNFSYFSLPAAHVKANLQSVSVAPSAGLSSTDRSGTKVKMPGFSSNPVESSLIDLTTSSRGVAGFQKPPVQIGSKVDIEPSTSIPAKELSSADQSGAISREGVSRTTEFTDKILRRTSSFAASTNAERPDTEKSVEPPVASSSMCSGNSAGGTSNDSKRKSREADESEYQSEDVEEESARARKQSNARGGSGAKRTRAAEVHNLSERRRRDRINEKMRALQELIPNCNKVDKASMLDEAIEYLKTLQLQVQIMSMGTGMYMPPMMLPTGMQRMPGQHMPHFPHMGVGMGMGMGMGMGFGMGMLDMGSGPSMLHVPPMHNMQFTCPPLSGHNNFPTMPGSNLQMFGHSGRGMPMPIPQSPYAPPSEGPFTKSVLVPDVLRTATSAESRGPASTSSSKDINLQVIQNANVETQQNPKSQQDQEARDDLKLSTLAQRHDQTPHVVATEKSTLPTGMGP